MYCSKCGSQVPDGSAFCPTCGQNPGGGSTGTNTRRVVEILLVVSYAALMVIALFLPWMRIDVFSSSMTWSFFEVVKLFFSGEGMAIVTALTLAMIVAAAGTVIIIVISLIDLASPEKDAPSSATSSTVWAIVLAVLFMIAYFIAHTVDDVGHYASLGAGCIMFLLTAIVYLFLLTYIPKQFKYVGTSISSDTKVTCPLCGTSYTKISAATLCPKCKGQGQKQPEMKPAPDHVTCPFCKQRYPAGTVFCFTCNARIGSLDSKPPIIRPTPTPPASKPSTPVESTPIVKPAPSEPATPPAPKPPQAEADSQDFIFCLQCGRKLPANAKFCGQCGTKVIKC